MKFPKLFKRKRKAKRYSKFRKWLNRQWKNFRRWFGRAIWPRIRKLVFFSIAAFTVWFIWLLLSLPDIDNLAKQKRSPSIVVKAENGDIIGSYGDVYGDFVSYKEIPRPLIKAVIATEDRNFFYHIGIDPLGILRASIVNMRRGKVVQGGSTITQQLAKNLFLSPKRTLSRKLREMLLAFKLEAHYSKKEILSIYLNRVYLGAGSFGVDAASKRYFGKSARELNLPESAILVGLLKAPSRYAPTSNPVNARARADQVLVNMGDAGFLTDKEMEKARAELSNSLKGKKPFAQSSYYFTDWVVDELPSVVGEELKEDVEVQTTFNPTLQRFAEEAIKKVMDEKAEKMKASQASLVSMLPDGAVKAMVGGRNYGESQFNRVVQSKRQPGSSFKLFVYLTGIEGGLSPDTIVNDQPVAIGNWTPQNYSGEYEGEMPLRQAVAKSINSVAVQVAVTYGLRNVVAMARSLGITSDIHPDPSIALGSNEVTLLELTTAYAHMASNGMAVTPYAITRVISKKGKLLYERKPSDPPRVLSKDVVGMMNSLLSGVVQYGTGTGANIGRSMAGKTGTTSDYKDAWFLGYTPNMATGVWVGNDTPTPMKKVTGGTLPAAIWKAYMQPATADLPPLPLPISNGGERDSEMLPWGGSSSGATSYTPDNASEPPPAEPGNQNPDDIELGEDFWNKLMQ